MNKKPKILYVITQSQWGGAQRYVYDLAMNVRGSYNVTVACGGGGVLIERLEAGTIRVEVFKNLVRRISLLRDLVCLWQLIRFMKREQFDVVHTNSTKAEILGNLAARVVGVRSIIFTAHGFVFNEPMSALKKWLAVHTERVASRFAHAIICVSKADKASAIAHHIAPQKKIVVIHNGIEPHGHSTSMVDVECPNNQEVIAVGTVANMYKTKGLEYLLQVAKMLPQYRFQIIGEGPERKNLELKIRDLGLKNIELLGFLDNPVDYVQRFTIFVSSSVKEGLPYAILEAMSFGIPIIATAVGGVPEIIEHNKSGILTPPASPKELADAIEHIVKDRRFMQELGKRAQEKVEKEFSIEAMLDATKTVYNTRHNLG